MTNPPHLFDSLYIVLESDQISTYLLVIDVSKIGVQDSLYFLFCTFCRLIYST